MNVLDKQERKIMKALFPLLTLVAVGCTQVNTTEVAFESRFGEISDKVLSSGLHFYNPITTDVIRMDLREQRFTLQTDAFTKDTQNSTQKISGTVAVSRDKAVHIYTSLGENWMEKEVTPVLLGSLKTVTGHFVADELIGQRGSLRDKVLTMVNEALANRGLRVTVLEIENIDFSDEYERAVEAKTKAYQHAEEAKNRTVQITEEARQKVISAKAEAEAMQIKSEALARNKGLVEYEAVLKWNGQLPTYMMGNATPFITLEKK